MTLLTAEHRGGWRCGGGLPAQPGRALADHSHPLAHLRRGARGGGGRWQGASGYFTGATGTTIYRGDAYGADFVNNSFTGDAGGQLVHRKAIAPPMARTWPANAPPTSALSIFLAASKDTWVRVVNFANAPDGCLHIIDMYREVIDTVEHPG